MGNTNEISENTVKYLTDLLGEGYDEKMRKILLDHEVQVQGLENVLEYQKTATKASLQKRLKRKMRARDLTLWELSKDERDKVVNEEFKTDKKKVAAAIMNVEKEIKKKIEHAENSLNNVNDIVRQRLVELGSKEEEEYQKVGNDFSAALLKSAEAFTDYKIQDESRQAAQENQRRIDRDVKKIRSRRDKDIEGIKTHIIEDKVAREEELRSKLELERSKSKSHLISEGLSEDEAEEKSTKEWQADSRKQLLELNAEYQEKVNKAIAEAVTKARDEERAVIDDTLKEVSEAAKVAVNVKDRSLAELERIKKEQEVEKEKLEATLSNNRTTREKALKERLAKRKAKKMESLSKQMENATNEEKEEILASAEGEIIQEEQEDLAQFHKDFDEEEERMRKEHNDKLVEIHQKASGEARLDEIAAAEAAAREDALRAAKDAEERRNAENMLREVQRRKDEATKEAEKTEKEIAAKKLKGRGNLEARLASKRAQKEKELKEKEEKERAELEAKHKQEEEKAEKARNTKNVWMSALQDAKEKAKILAGGLVDKALYDFLVAETLGKKLVPDEQMFDALNTIFESKHAQEEAELINSQYDERVAALKPAVEKIQANMKVEREALLEKLEKEKADETIMKQAVNEFADEYARIQRTEEDNIAGQFEAKHMKQQTDLRMKQMQEVKLLVELYSDEENLDALRAAAGEAQLQEMAKFRASLEKEKKEREEKLRKEREDVEARMLEEHEAEIEKRRQEFIAEKERAEAEMKKMEADAEARKQEAARIHAAKIKEAHEKQAQEADEARNAAKKLQNKKLQERLAKKKQRLTESGKFTDVGSRTAGDDVHETTASIEDESRAKATAIFDAIATESAIDARGAVPIQLSSSLSLIEKKLSQI